MVLICVPTLLTRHLEPDLKYVESTTRAIAKTLRRGQLVILESTTYPGTTREVMQPILEETGLIAGKDFFLAYSPEREDPGNPTYSTTKIPKVVGADDTASAELALADLSPHRAPGDPGLVRRDSGGGEDHRERVPCGQHRAGQRAQAHLHGDGHRCVRGDRRGQVQAVRLHALLSGPGPWRPLHPDRSFYLTWKAREYNQHTKFIELAGQINADMPQHVVRVLADTMDARFGRGLRGARILVLGVAYKKNVEDIRESPSLRLMEMIEARGATADFHDPHVAQIDNTREHPTLNFRRGMAWDEAAIADYDAVLIATDHDAVDYAALVASAKLVLDTRNACGRAGVASDNVVRA